MHKSKLYNLSSDIQEKNDVSSAHPELVHKMSDKLELWKIEVTKGVNLLSN